VRVNSGVDSDFKRFFCEQKEVKNFEFLEDSQRPASITQLAEVFWFFFQKRTSCFLTISG
jgi:hypothetical protein